MSQFSPRRDIMLFYISSESSCIFRLLAQKTHCLCNHSCQNIKALDWILFKLSPCIWKEPEYLCHYSNESTDCVTRECGFVWVRTRDFPIFQSIQTGSGTYLTFFRIDSRGYFLGSEMTEVRFTTHLHVWSCTYALPYAVMAWLMYSSGFTMTFYCVCEIQCFYVKHNLEPFTGF